jgi:hypothetical protein
MNAVDPLLRPRAWIGSNDARYRRRLAAKMPMGLCKGFSESVPNSNRNSATFAASRQLPNSSILLVVLWGLYNAQV